MSTSDVRHPSGFVSPSLFSYRFLSPVFHCLPPCRPPSFPPVFLQSVPLSVPRQTLPSAPIPPPRLARPLLFHPVDPSTTPILLSVWLYVTQMLPKTSVHSIPSYFSSLLIVVSVHPPIVSSSLSPLLASNRISCSPSPSLSPTAQMPGLVCNSCLAMCHYRVLLSIAGPTWKGWRRWRGGGGCCWWLCGRGWRVQSGLYMNIHVPFHVQPNRKWHHRGRLHPSKNGGRKGKEEMGDCEE